MPSLQELLTQRQYQIQPPGASPAWVPGLDSFRPDDDRSYFQPPTPSGMFSPTQQPYYNSSAFSTPSTPPQAPAAPQEYAIEKANREWKPPPPGVDEPAPGNVGELAIGLAKNFLIDNPVAIITGIGGLVTAVNRDFWGGVAEVIPGQQDWLGEEHIQREGYRLADIGRMVTGYDLPGKEGEFHPTDSIILEDFASRYGLHGWNEMKDQIYNQPMSYLLDFLAVGQAAKMGAKLGNKLGVVSNAGKARVLGISEDYMRAAEEAAKAEGLGRVRTHIAKTRAMRPHVEVLDPLAIQGAEKTVFKVPLSPNPSARLIQSYVLQRVFTRSADRTSGLLRAIQGQGPLYRSKLGRAIASRGQDLPDEAAAARILGLDPETATGTAKRIQKMLDPYYLGGEEPPLVAKPFFSRSTTVNRWGPAKMAQAMFGLSRDRFFNSRNEMVIDLRRRLDKVWEQSKGKTAYASAQAEKLAKTLWEKNVIDKTLQYTGKSGEELQQWLEALNHVNVDDVAADIRGGILLPPGVGLPKRVSGESLTGPGSSLRNTYPGQIIDDIFDLPEEERQYLTQVDLHTRVDPETGKLEPVKEGVNNYSPLGNPDRYRAGVAHFEDKKRAPKDTEPGEVFGHVDWVHPMTPEELLQLKDEVGLNRREEYWVLAGDDLSVAPLGPLATETGEALGGKLERIVNWGQGAAGEEGFARGVQAFYRGEKGERFAVWFVDPRLKETLQISGKIQRHMRELMPIQNQLLAEIFAAAKEYGDTVTLKPDGTVELTGKARYENWVRSQRLEKVVEELDAALLYSRDVFRPWERQMGGDFIDPMLEVADELYLWQQRWGMENYVKSFKMDNPRWWMALDEPDNEWAHGRFMRGPYAEAANRAIAPFRYEVWHHQAANLRAALVKELRKYPNMSRDSSEAMVMDVLKEFKMSYERRYQYPDFIQIKDIILDRLWEGNVKWEWAGKSGAALTGAIEETVNILLERLYKAAQDPILKWGDVPGWRWQDLIPELPQTPVYYPHIGKGGMDDVSIWARKIPPEQLERTVDGRTARTRQWTGRRWAEGSVDLDLADAYTSMGTGMLRHLELKDVIRKLEKFARPATEAEVLMMQTGGRIPGYKVWNPHGIRSRIDIHGKIMDSISRKLYMDNKSFTDAASEAIASYTEDLIRSGEVNLQKNPVMLIPEHIAKAAIQKSILPEGWNPGLRLFWDGPRDLWRASVLGMNPRWVIMNEMGNIMFTAIKDPTSIKRIFRNSDRATEAYVKAVMNGIQVPGYEGTLAESISRGFFGSQDFTKYRNWAGAEKGWPRITGFLDRIYNSQRLPVRGVKGWTSWVRGTGTSQEQAARLGISLGEYNRLAIDNVWDRFRGRNLDIVTHIAKNGVDSNTLEDMVNIANKVLGDYTGLNPFERQLIRRFIVPFYPFYRHIVKFAARMPYDVPGKAWLFRYIDMLDKEMAPLVPEYLGDAVQLSRFGGLDLFLNLRSANPLNQLAEGEMLNLLDPTIATGIQWALGINDWGEPYDPAEVSNGQVYEAGNGMMFKKEGGKWVPFSGRVRPPLWKMYLSNWGTPMQFFNLPGYKSKSGVGYARVIDLAQMMGLPLTRTDLAKYQKSYREAEKQAYLYGGR